MAETIEARVATVGFGKPRGLLHEYFWGLFFFFSVTEDGASKHPAQKKTQDFYQLFAKIHRYGLIGV